MKVAFIFGTRPEVIKLAPVILTLKKRKKITCILISTGQQNLLFKEALAAFDLHEDENLAIMKHDQSLAYILSSAVSKLDEVFSGIKQDLTVVLGDTSSAFAGALVSYYHQIPVAHIEAGCRTDNIYEPFPEEANRRLIANLAEWHFPATKRMEDNLRREGYNKNIYLVGSTEADAVDRMLKNKSAQELDQIIPDLRRMKRIVVITTHRRENWGKPLTEVFSGLKILAEQYPQINFIYSVHPNPLVLKPARKALSGLENLQIIPHIPAAPFVHLVNKAMLVMTDSGGIQLQCGALLKPVLILRNVTEWSELIEGGIGRLVGTNEQKIIDAFKDFLQKKWPVDIPGRPIYSKGATEKIADIISSRILK